MNFVRLFTPLACLFIPFITHSDELAEASRAVVAQNADAVVTIKLGVEITFSSPDYGSEEQEFIIEATGFFINSRGYVAASLTATDPAGYYDDLGDDEFNVRTEISDVTVLLGNGTSFRAQVALRDRDLDVVILKPQKEPKESLPFIQFSHDARPQKVDPVIILRRLGKVAGRACIALTPRIDHIMKKPRPFYVIHDPGIGLGEPAFSKNGACFGIVTLRSVKVAEAETFSVFSELELDSTVVILPGEDVIEIASQVPGFADEPTEDRPPTSGR